MVMIELVYCKITGKTRSLPKVHHFIPLAPWTCTKIKGKKRVMNIDNRNDGPSSKYEKKEQIKLVLDMSNDGPMFKMLESMLSGGKNGEKGAFNALHKLLRSGIPGLESMFSQDGSLKFNKMSDEDKKRFIEAVTGSGGKIDSKAAAALIAAAASGGDPEIANKIIEKMMSGLGDEIDPAMMSALMATTALVAQGASNEEILAAMQRELAASGLSPEEILAKTLLLQKAMAGDNSPAFINKTIRNALNMANITPEELSKAVYAEKVMAAAGATPEDLAKTLLIQTILKQRGVSSAVIAEALNKILSEENAASSCQLMLSEAVEAALRQDSVSTDEITKFLALPKALEGGKKIRGMKELQQLLEAASVLDTPEAVAEVLRQIIEAGVLTHEAIPKALAFQKAIAAAGGQKAGAAETLAKAILMQKAMQEGGMAVNDIANAVTLAMGLVSTEEAEQLKALKEILRDCIVRGLSPDDIDIVLAFREALEAGGDMIPKEAINLMKKAMKQRRGSVDNVAETLMASLAASGQSQESIAKAMVKALQATGATPQEIAKTMQSAMEKCGATQEEIAKAMAAAMAASGASAEEIASALKETFAKAMAADPAAAADIARAMACALAAAGASAEDIARTMQEALAASVGAAGGTGACSPEDLLEIAQTVARAMAEAGASPEDISAAMRSAIAAAGKCDDPELLAELTKAMAKAMADAGASGEEIARAMQEAMAASGVSEEEIAENILKAMAASGAPPDVIAKTMQAAMARSGMSQEEIQRHVIEAMVESGATAEEIAQAIVAQNLFSAIGGNPEDMAKQLLEDLRSGKDITLESIHRILQAGGIEPEMATRVLMFQKALAACGADPEDIAKAILLQKAWLNGYGSTPENIAKVLEDIIAANAENGRTLEQNLINIILNKLVSDDMGVDDVMKALQFDKALDMSGASVNSIKELMDRAAGGGKKKGFDQHDLSQAIQELLCSNSATAEAIVKAAVLQKLLTALALASPDEVAKLVAIQKVMYESGATPQDISMLMEMALGGSSLKLEAVVDGLRSELQRRLGPADILNIIELAEAFQGTKIPAELISKIMLMQKAIEADISSPEQTSADLAAKLKRPKANAEALAADMLALLKKNGLGPESLEKSVLLQRAAAAAGLTAKELELVLGLQERMIEAGRTADDVALAFMGFVAKAMGGGEMKAVAQQLMAALDQGRVKEEDLVAGATIFEAIKALHGTKNGGGKNHSSSNGTNGVHGGQLDGGAAIILREMSSASSHNDIINIMRKAIEADKLRPEQVLKVLLLLKMITASEATPGDLAKALRIQKALMASGVVADVLCRTINETIKPRKKALLDKIKQPLLDLVNSCAAAAGNSGSIFSLCGQDVTNGRDYCRAITTNVQADDSKLKEIFENAMKVAGLSKEDIARALLVQKTLAASGLTPDIMAQAVMFQKALAAAGISPDEIADIFNRAIAASMSEESIASLIAGVMAHKGCSREDIEKIVGLQRSLRAGVLALGSADKFGGSGSAADLLTSGSLGGMDAGLLAKALLMQKILSVSGLSPEDLGKAFLLQQAMIEAGASADNVAGCMHRTLLESGISLEHLITLMEIELKAALANKGGLTGQDVARTLQFERILGASGSAKRILRKINPEALRLMEATVKKSMPGGGPLANSNLMEAMKGALGNILDVSTLQAMEVSAAMAAAGASKAEIEEMMTMILNRGGGISDDFIESIKEAMAAGGKSPFEKLNALKAAMEEEMNSVTNALRNTFINRIPTPEEIAHACNTLAEKLAADAAARTDVKLALVDVLDEALQDVLEYEPDADMIFNYLMVSALAAATDYIERNGIKPTGGDLQEIARREMLEMVERLLLEADLEKEVPKLEVYGKTIDGIKEFLNFLLKNTETGKALKRQVAFLFDFEEIEHTTVLGLTLQDIIKDAKHRLRPWELEKKRKIRGLKRAVVPNLGYSQIYCYYRVLPEHLEGPPIGLAYE